MVEKIDKSGVIIWMLIKASWLRRHFSLKIKVHVTK